MEKPLIPAWLISKYSMHHKRVIYIPMVIDSGIQSMDIYNQILSLGLAIEGNQSNHGWLTNKGRYLTSEEAAIMLYEADLLDRKLVHLTLADYQGAWKG